MKSIRMAAYGGPEVMVLEEAPAPVPGQGQLLVRVEAAGVNYIDVYHRTGQYKVPLPYAMGSEGAGVVEAVGPSAEGAGVGDRVAWALAPGSYATHVLVPWERAVPLPEGLDSTHAAAVMLQGMTAHYLTHSTHPLRSGETCLIHAAAGGVGLLLIQVAKKRGARVIGTVSNEDKAKLARDAGADEIVMYKQEDVAPAVRKLTGGRGVEVVYDSVGKDTYLGSLDCLAPRGMLVLFGQSSGAVPPMDPQVLSAKGSVFLTRPTLGHYVATREELLFRTKDLFSWLAAGTLHLRIGGTFPLAQAREAHRALEGRNTTGKLVLLP